MSFSGEPAIHISYIPGGEPISNYSVFFSEPRLWKPKVSATALQGRKYDKGRDSFTGSSTVFALNSGLSRSEVDSAVPVNKYQWAQDPIFGFGKAAIRRNARVSI